MAAQAGEQRVTGGSGGGRRLAEAAADGGSIVDPKPAQQSIAKMLRVVCLAFFATGVRLGAVPLRQPLLRT